MERWRDIPNFEGIYEVSDIGRIRSSKDKTTKSKLHGERKWKQRILKLKTDKNGYKRVTLWKNKKPHDYLVHRLVAIAYLPVVTYKECVNHMDGNPSNNHLGNLEWCDYRENLIHAFENRLNKNADPVILFNTNNKEMHYFISKAEAGRFLGRSHGFISDRIKKGIKEVDEYLIFQY